jgi:hypothetical protein
LSSERPRERIETAVVATSGFRYAGLASSGGYSTH